jgi:L-ascorbate metabolism protein UlaG (beta-lactamase superfamily)
MVETPSQGTFTFVGNATALIRWGPFTLLTDPNFLLAGQRAYLGNGLTSRRLHDPALQVHELPPVDAVVLSHLHGDHWDRVTRKGLDRSLPVLTTPKAARTLQGRQHFRRALGLRTWESHTLVKDRSTVRVTALPGRHAPGVAQLLLPPVMGSLLEFGEAGGEVRQRVYVTGDTLMYDDIRQIRERFPGIDLTVIHLGGTTLPGGLMVTMDGEQGAELVETVLPRQVIPVHFNDYDRFKSPLSDFLEKAESRGLRDRVTEVSRGGTIAFGS